MSLRARRQKFKRLAVRIEVGIVVGLIALTGATLLLISLIVYLSNRIPLYQALILVALLLFLVAICGWIGVQAWEGRRIAAQEEAGEEADFTDALPDPSSIAGLVRQVSSGPMGVATSALVSQQLRKSPVTTGVGLAAIGLLMLTQNRRRDLKTKHPAE
ncbi:hypothetical protein [Parvularcula maris]|uniref:Uncharacterized protein n=1 Tax=Parvularcula maris TaxID=2965077 RepID=A0A9X2RH02_9PROT|nr:hypothetical protein [Parvularcula maris]MCQ8184425.1 hypothetical protein [Parvularcula maris]